VGEKLAGQLVEIVIGILGQIAHPALLFPYLDGKYRGRSVADALVSRGEQLADDATPLGRGVGAVIDRRKDHLIAAARVDGVHVVNKRLH